MASTSSSSKTTYYDVFISFRGADTRDNFTSHLHQKLVDKNIKTFIDNNLDRGEKIDLSLMKVIEESQISAIVFSEGYASSQWCLDELVKILECRKTMGQTVLPIFYHVDPSDVEQLTGIFGDGYRKLQAEHENSGDQWRKALEEATTLSGWDWKNHRPDSELVEVVVKEIVKKIISLTSYSIAPGLVGIESRIQEILRLLGSGSDDKPHFLGLWGMAGIGKTTIAEALYSQLSTEFDGRCFLRNGREKSSNIVDLKKTLFSELLRCSDLRIEMSQALPDVVIHMLRKMKVIIVLDDVNDSDQLEVLLARDQDLFGEGSKIIVTSRDKQVLQNIVDDIYEVRELNYNDALQLLSMKAFKGKQPSKCYTELLKRALDYAKGVPLALKVLGSHVYERSPEVWEIELGKIEQHPDPKIQNVLKLSYDELEEKLKNIFLDIACFFRRRRKDLVKDILMKNYGLEYFECGIMRLVDKCLITIWKDDKLEMHDLIQEMGQDIAEKDGSRLQNSNVLHQMLTNKKYKGKDAVQGICSNISKIGKVHLHPKAFSSMYGLRLLKFYWPWTWYKEKNKRPVFMLESECLHSLPNMLSLLHWEQYPCKSLPSKFSMENLVKLNITGSNVTQLWDGNKCPQNLKQLDLSYCRQLKRLPNLSWATNLEAINLTSCESLVEIDSSIKCLQKLARLYLSKCKKLKILPEIPRGIKALELSDCGVEEWSPSIEFLDNLEWFRMSNCINITSLPINLRLNFSLNHIIQDNLYLRGCRYLCKLPLPKISGHIRFIDLSETAIEELPSLTGCVSSLVSLRMSNCKSLESLPDSICELKCLKDVNLSGCLKLAKLPPLYGLSSLRNLSLDETAIEELPSSFGCLSSLEFLSMKNCKNLKIFPDSICELKCLEVLDLGGCSKLAKLPPLYGLSSLRNLSLDETAIEELPSSFGYLSSLEYSSMQNCKNLEILPNSICQLKCLEALDLTGCSKLAKLPLLYGLSSLRKLSLDETALVEIPNDIVSLSSLEVLNLKNCKRLHLPKLPQHLQELRVQNCTSLRTVEFHCCSANFCNCVNLEDDTRSNILAIDFNNTEEEHIGGTSLIVCVPGREIPEWYRYQNEGSSIAIQFPPTFDTMFFDFALSLALEFDSKLDELSVKCQCYLENAIGDINFHYSWWMDFYAILESDHVFLLHLPTWELFKLRDWLIENNSHVNEASFEFSVTASFGSRKLKVKKCGVYLIYDKEQKEGSPATNRLQTNILQEPNTSNLRCTDSAFVPSTSAC